MWAVRERIRFVLLSLVVVIASPLALWGTIVGRIWIDLNHLAIFSVHKNRTHKCSQTNSYTTTTRCLLLCIVYFISSFCVCTTKKHIRNLEMGHKFPSNTINISRLQQNNKIHRKILQPHVNQAQAKTASMR